jgi:hypothetical protein
VTICYLDASVLECAEVLLRHLEAGGDKRPTNQDFLGCSLCSSPVSQLSPSWRRTRMFNWTNPSSFALTSGDAGAKDGASS